MATQILVVDDEPRYLRLLEANLKTEGHEVFTAGDGVQALDIFSSRPFDLVLLDILMPRLDGFAVCQRIRAFSNVPIMMLTAKGEEQDRVKGLDLGADDYLVKPFSATELLARVRAVLRRTQMPVAQAQERFFSHHDLKIDFARAEVWRGEQSVSLSATEYRLLLQFAHNVGKILTSEDLLTEVWGPEYRSDREILWVSIARLRQKLEEDAHNPRHVVTRSGLGYFMPPVEP
jgi:DNA-binding response OmpR family regulator